MVQFRFRKKRPIAKFGYDLAGPVLKPDYSSLHRAYHLAYREVRDTTVGPHEARQSLSPTTEMSLNLSSISRLRSTKRTEQSTIRNESPAKRQRYIFLIMLFSTYFTSIAHFF